MLKTSTNNGIVQRKDTFFNTIEVKKENSAAINEDRFVINCIWAKWLTKPELIPVSVARSN